MKNKIINYLKKVRYKILISDLSRELSEKIKSSKNILKLFKFKNKRVLLPLIETSHYKSIQLLLIAKALQLRGSTVYVLVCDEILNICEIKSVQKDNKEACWKCNLGRKKLINNFGLNVIFLSNYINQFSDKYVLENLIEIKENFSSLNSCVDDSLIRYFYGNVPSDSKLVDKIRQRHLITAAKIWLVAEKLFSDLRLNLVLGYMLAYSEFAPFYYYSKYKNIPFKIVSSTQFNLNAQIFNWPDLYNSDSRFQNYLKSRKNLFLSKKEKKILNDFLNKRIENKDSVLKELGISKSNQNDLSKFGIEIDNSKKNIFLFSNVFWDVGFSEMTTIFSSIPDWVFETIKIISNSKDTHLYIRCHPAESLSYSDEQKGIKELIFEEFDLLPPNITIISSDNDVSSYKLFPYIDLALVYNGTIGVELLCNMIPVVVAGQSPYGFLRSVHNPKNISEYIDILKSKTKEKLIEKNEVEIFAYFYLIKTSIPWNLTSKAYNANLFSGLNFNSIDFLYPEGDKYLNHLCNCLVDEKLSPEFWN